MKTNKMMIIPIRREIIADLLTGIDVVIMKDGTTRKFSGIPEDMRLEQLHYDPSRDSLNLVVSSEAFEEVPELGELPFPLFEEETLHTKHIKLILSKE